jgi:argininosuccinate lyase
MPSSLGLWFHALFEELLEELKRSITLLGELDANPLGGTAGFGTSMAVDPRYVAKLLGLQRVYRSPIHANNSRGRVELRILQWLSSISAGLERFFWDISLFCTREFGFFKLPNKLTTGSSIMPQKRNPDLVELARGRCAKIRGAENELSWIVGKLPTSYHRELQLTKEPVFRAFEEIDIILKMAELIVNGLEVDEKRVRECMYDDLYATYDAYREVQAGVPFREAYRRTAERVKSGKIKAKVLATDFQPIAKRANTAMKEAKGELITIKTKIKKQQLMIAKSEREIFRVS